MPATIASKEDMAFVRVREAYDLAHLAACRVVCVGAGGSAGFIEDLARTGIGQIVIIDPDVIELPNVARQMVYRRDVGRPKVAALAERLRDINPHASIQAHSVGLETISRDDMLSLLHGPWPATATPAQTLLCGLTDSFAAQARINALALHFGIPSLCAQTYAEGRGGEITFTYPGVTPACHRCILKRRYDYHAVHSSHPVTSHGSPIFTTTLINALKGYVALALLHHGTGHNRWGSTLAEIANRNLIQVRLDPNVATSLAIGVFDRVLAGADHSRLYFGEPIWLPQAPEPSCPDCGGDGDLRNSIGTFRDTGSSLRKVTKAETGAEHVR
jgi:molybdopterin/thiamine biosynthesis adenylyltransferase